MSVVAYTPLTPLAFLRRSAEVYPDKDAVVYAERRVSYVDFAAQTTRVARALRASGVQPGDRVAYLLPNLPEMLVAHFGVPLAGAVVLLAPPAADERVRMSRESDRERERDAYASDSLRRRDRDRDREKDRAREKERERERERERVRERTERDQGNAGL